MWLLYLLIAYIVISEILAVYTIGKFIKTIVYRKKFEKTKNRKYEQPVLSECFLYQDLILYVTCLWLPILIIRNIISWLR